MQEGQEKAGTKQTLPSHLILQRRSPSTQCRLQFHSSWFALTVLDSVERALTIPGRAIAHLTGMDTHHRSHLGVYRTVEKFKQ